MSHVSLLLASILNFSLELFFLPGQSFNMCKPAPFHFYYLFLTNHTFSTCPASLSPAHTLTQ